jgi:hypothetical protein
MVKPHAADRFFEQPASFFLSFTFFFFSTWREWHSSHAAEGSSRIGQQWSIPQWRRQSAAAAAAAAGAKKTFFTLQVIHPFILAAAAAAC